jgi:hypothetical protein
MKGPRKAKNFFKKLSVSLLGTILFFTVFEIILRVTGPKKEYKKESALVFYEYDELLG